ncbi:kinesin-like protein KIN-1 [Dendroctonus ponderosae]|uniref:kinesin-like protein KIN-1 n=1 Tax=Dendroctonus ponderosae TaxID=77166 RepID=UPI0020364A59|nr:kinesin-like protein KIN-1 [Dendroctonus ponderosae]
MSFKKRVFFRIFPTEKTEFEHIKLDSKTGTIYVRHLQELSKNNIKTDRSYWKFETDGIFYNSTQETVYNDVTAGVLEEVINGNNAVIASFGQTGSGKTFTISGLHITENEFGILPRIAKDFLALRKSMPNNIKLGIDMSYVEFYNTFAIDLLKPDLITIEISKCREVRKVQISNEFEALKCIFLGEARKNFKQGCRYLSNLDTNVATFHITKKDMDLTNPVKICSRLHIIDMAGNDTCGNMKLFCKNPKEIGLANVTKSQLEQFILCLSTNISKNIRVKQRINSLIYYLNGDFASESILRFIGHIKAKNEDLLITLSMLRFGNILKGLKMKRKVMQFELNEEVELQYLRNKLQSIEKDQHLNSVLLNRDLVTGMNPERIKHLHNLIQDYLAGNVQEIPLMNVADAGLVLENIRTLCKGLENEIKALQIENQGLVAHQQSEVTLKQKSSKSSSHSTIGKLSRRSSKARSKESITKENKQSGSNIAEKQKLNETGELSIASSQKRKKSVTKSSTSGMNKATNRKKSSNTSVEKRDSKSSVKSLDVQMPIPEMIPEKQDMWRRFASSSHYKERVEEYKQNEQEIKSHFSSYVHEIKKLQKIKDDNDKHINDLLLAQTYRKFNSKDEFDEQGLLVLSYAEKECKERLDETREMLVDQQEITLTAQEALKAYLDNRQNIIKSAESEFDQFCAENYQVPSVDIQLVQNDLNPYTFDANIEDPDSVLEKEEELTFIPEPPAKTQIIRNLQTLLQREQRARIKAINRKKQEWRNV